MLMNKKNWEIIFGQRCWHYTPNQAPSIGYKNFCAISAFRKYNDMYYFGFYIKEYSV